MVTTLPYQGWAQEHGVYKITECKAKGSKTHKQNLARSYLRIKPKENRKLNINTNIGAPHIIPISVVRAGGLRSINH